MLTQIELDTLVKRIVTRLAPEKIILFGSHAKGSASARSDVDFLVIMETEVAPAHRARLLPPLLHGSAITVDVHVYTPGEVRAYATDPLSFISNILDTGRTVFERDAGVVDPAAIRAVGAIHFSAMLDALKAYDVVEKLLELSFAGSLPLTQAGGGRLLLRYFRDGRDRITAQERRSLYAGTLGVPGGEPQGESNREFNELWRRFVAAVSEFTRQHAQDIRPDPPEGNAPPAIGQEDVRARAKALALNVSRHGDGARPLAILLNEQLSQLIDVLSDREIQDAFGVRGIWRLIERVSSLHLGGSRSTVPYRARAESGATVFAWLASRPPDLWTSGGAALDEAVIASQQRGDEPRTDPTDYDLAEACEQWLAVAGIEADIDELARPAETREMSDAVRAFLSGSAAFAQLSPLEQAQIARDTVRIADYLAVMESPSVAQELLDEIDFPQFVADLIKGTFDAMLEATMEQMRAYKDLLAAVAASVDEFRNPRISERLLLAHLCEAYPPLCKHDARTPSSDRYPHPLDTLAAGAWRRLASSRQQLLATMVVTGINRIAASVE